MNEAQWCGVLGNPAQWLHQGIYLPRRFSPHPELFKRDPLALSLKERKMLTFDANDLAHQIVWSAYNPMVTAGK